MVECKKDDSLELKTRQRDLDLHIEGAPSKRATNHQNPGQGIPWHIDQIQAIYLVEPYNEFTTCFHSPGVKGKKKKSERRVDSHFWSVKSSILTALGRDT